MLVLYLRLYLSLNTVLFCLVHPLILPSVLFQINQNEGYCNETDGPFQYCTIRQNNSGQFQLKRKQTEYIKDMFGQALDFQTIF